MSEKELREMERVEIRDGMKVKNFVDRNKFDLERQFWSHVRKHRNVEISFLACRKNRYSLYYCINES